MPAEGRGAPTRYPGDFPARAGGRGRRPCRKSQERRNPRGWTSETLRQREHAGNMPPPTPPLRVGVNPHEGPTGNLFYFFDLRKSVAGITRTLAAAENLDADMVQRHSHSTRNGGNRE